MENSETVNLRLTEKSEDRTHYLTLRMTQDQLVAYQAGRFAPTYWKGQATEVLVDDDGTPIELHDVTAQGVPL